MLIYIPINIYNGYFRMDNLCQTLSKDIVFDGTFISFVVSACIYHWRYNCVVFGQKSLTMGQP